MRLPQAPGLRHGDKAGPAKLLDVCGPAVSADDAFTGRSLSPLSNYPISGAEAQGITSGLQAWEDANGVTPILTARVVATATARLKPSRVETNSRNRGNTHGHYSEDRRQNTHHHGRP